MNDFFSNLSTQSLNKKCSTQKSFLEACIKEKKMRWLTSSKNKTLLHFFEKKFGNKVGRVNK